VPRTGTTPGGFAKERLLRVTLDRVAKQSSLAGIHHRSAHGKQLLAKDKTTDGTGIESAGAKFFGETRGTAGAVFGHRLRDEDRVSFAVFPKLSDEDAALIFRQIRIAVSVDIRPPLEVCTASNV
jgi:hypothetical protein